MPTETAASAAAELAALAPGLEAGGPGAVLGWAGERFGADLVVAVSFEDAVLPHLVASHAPRAQVIMLDTQYLFAETEWFAQRLTRRLGLNLRVVRPTDDVQPDDRWETDVEGCCHVRKVLPLAAALAGKPAWVTGVRRADGPTRAGVQVVEWDAGRSMVKVNPLAAWTDEDLAAHVAQHDLPAHPLVAKGYTSIGCWPCTRPVAPGEDRRAGRWAGLAKTECGLHQ